MTQSVQISAAKDGSALTLDQKRFNTLIRQIEQVRQTLTTWHDNIPLYAQAHTQVIVPLMQALCAARRQTTFALDRLLDQRGWTKAERVTLRELICASVSQLLQDDDDEDEALKALFDKHSEVDFDTEQKHSRIALKDLVETMTGLDLGDAAEIVSDEDLLKRMHESLAGRFSGADAQEASAAPARRRRMTAAQRRAESEAQLATQSMREIFRKLASALHPDRETDPTQREAKTVLMQKVNQAYAANNLLTLLELQLQIEQVDADHLANASAQRLKHYNKVLSEQLVELKAEVTRVETGFRFSYGLEASGAMNPTKLVKFIDQNAKLLRADIAMRQRDMRMLADKSAIKRWLKSEQQQLYDAEFF